MERMEKHAEEQRRSMYKSEDVGRAISDFPSIFIVIFTKFFLFIQAHFGIIWDQENRNRYSPPQALSHEPRGIGVESNKQHVSPSTSDNEGDDDVVEEEVPICLVCREAEDADDVHNPIVICDGCSVSVHAECYGDPLTQHIPDADEEWLCQQCLMNASGEKAACVLCPNVDARDVCGPMKRTSDWRWAHIQCAMWVPEVFFRNGGFGRFPIDVLHVPSKRYNMTCSHCHEKNGACLECSESKCKAKMHVPCAQQNGMYLEYKERQGVDVVISFCQKHSEKWNKRNIEAVVVQN